MEGDGHRAKWRLTINGSEEMGKFRYQSLNPEQMCYQFTMSQMKKKKKGANDPPVNNNRSDLKNSKPSTAIIGAEKGSKGKK